MASTSYVVNSHFDGFPQIFQEIASDRIEYDEAVAPRPTLTAPRLGADVGACYEA
jgi:hypothetical protein